MIRGAFGPIHPFSVEGWAYDDCDAALQLEIQFRVDGVTIGEAIANTRLRGIDHREGGVDHGFFKQFQKALPHGERHRLTVLAKGFEGRTSELPFALPAKAQVIYPLPSFDDGQHPVFILGSVRSGTTAVMEGLRSCTRFGGPGEGHLLELSIHLHVFVQRFYAERRAAQSLRPLANCRHRSTHPRQSRVFGIRRAGASLARSIQTER